MPSKSFAMALAKVVIAAAWADGELANEEVNALKDLLFLIPSLTGAEWQELEIYLDSQVGEEEAERLLAEMLGMVRTSADKTLVLETLEQLVAADGVVTPEEKAMLADMKDAVETSKTGIVGLFGRLVGGSVGRRREACAAAPNREARLDDFVANSVYYDLVGKMEAGQAPPLKIPQDRLRQLCCLAGLMGIVAGDDREVSAAETQAIAGCLEQDWELGREEAELLAEIAGARSMKGLDCVRLCREFYGCASADELRQALRSLFQVANSCTKTSADEIQRIREIAGFLKLPHREFIEAKLTVSREDRAGL